MSQVFQNITLFTGNKYKTMYATNPNSMHKYSFQWRNDSGELDVFEAAQYFSRAVDDQIPGNFNNAAKFSQEVISEERKHQVQRVARMSLDSLMRDQIAPQNHAKDSNQIKENKKHRQPSSPGGRLASFLNSLFNQTRSKKRKSQFVGPKYLQVTENPGERRERRSSISHFRINTNTKNVDSKSGWKFCSSSGFMQTTPTKPFFEHQKHKNGGNLKPNNYLKNQFCSEKMSADDAWIEEFRFNKDSGMSWFDEYTSEEREFRKFSDCDDGGDTDSSSDLFELSNCDFEFHPNGLPVYETTRLNSAPV